MQQLRTLGNSGVGVSPIGLGCMGMSMSYKANATEEESLATLHLALDLGCNLWDTADAYGAGANEELLAKVLRDRRRDVFLCTKFGFAGVVDGAFVIRGDAEYVRQACDASLRRLGVEQIDLYYQHRVDPNTPIEDTVRAMAGLVKEGKVRYLGLSEASASAIRRAHAVHPIAAYQVEYSPWSTDIEENGILATCRELGIAIVAYSPVGRGFLTGNLRSADDLAGDDWRKDHPRFTGDAFAANLRVVDRIREIAARKGVTPAQLCLAWVLAQGPDFIPIPGTTKRGNLRENLGAAGVALTAEEAQEVRSAVAEVGVVGTRYKAGMKGLINADSV